MSDYKRGDLLVYKKQKRSRQPGPRARSIAAAVQDGKFMYVVDKFWIVAEICEDGMLDVRTRLGKRHRLNPADPNVRHPSWWQRLLYRSRFRELQQSLQA